MCSRFGLAFLCLGLGWAQTPAATPPAPPTPEISTKPEMSTKDETATFRSRVNLVMVPVVVRDKTGQAVGNLRQEDFQLLDRGKPQVITRFTLEKAETRRSGDKASNTSGRAELGDPVAPERYIAYLFDDAHLPFGDLARARDAAVKQMQSLKTTDRAAIFTTSGQNNLEFTDDRDALEATLSRLMPHPSSILPGLDCPDLGVYQADLIQNRNDAEALRVATDETLVCANLDPSTDRQVAESQARATATRVTSIATQDARVTLYTLRDAVRRMAAAPGQRIIVLASPGFLAINQQIEKTDVMDRAIRANVIINSLDARGLYTDPSMDASQRSGIVGVMQYKSRYIRDTASMQADVLAELAYGTGGLFFQNNNDLEEGFRRLASMPDYLYMLGFSPQNLKLDGSFHALKVALKTAGLNLDARKGYYAPKQLDDAAETARQEIEEAVFSREEVRELPIDLASQFFKPGDDVARVSILARIDLKGIHFRKAEGRNNNTLTIVSVVFDRNGNYVTGNRKTVEMRLRDETLVTRAEQGITVRSQFDVKPGVYLVRLVVRDSEGQLMTAQNGAVDIPK